MKTNFDDVDQGATKLIGDALQNSYDGDMAVVKTLSRVGVTSNRWETFKIKFWLFFRQPQRAQRIILDSLRREM